MNITKNELTEKQVMQIFEIEEDHFNDFKAKDISGQKLSKSISAFGNASGGDIYIGIREESRTKNKHWEGFSFIEDGNSFIQVIESMPEAAGYYNAEFLKHPKLNTYVLRLSIFKTKAIVKTTDGNIFVRKGSQCLPINTPEKLRRLELDKGITSYEDEPISNSILDDVLESKIFHLFTDSIIPEVDPVIWLKKQRLLVNEKLTVAGEMLFSDEPQICLPKRSAIKIYRYKTSNEADRAGNSQAVDRGGR